MNYEKKKRLFKILENFNVLSKDFNKEFKAKIDNSFSLNKSIAKLRKNSQNKIKNITKGLVKVYKNKVINLPILYFGYKKNITEDSITFEKENEFFIFKFIDKNNNIVPTKYLDYSEYTYETKLGTGETEVKKDCLQIRIKKDYKSFDIFKC